MARLLGQAKRVRSPAPRQLCRAAYPGVLSSYPNFIFNVPAAQVPAFVDAMESAPDAAAFERIVEHWGIRRSHPQFWEYFHDLSRYIQQTDPLEAGVLDMNRYQNL
ncbi:fatty acid cis/trans isomerase [Pseudomonas sp. SWRI154]|uniref:fatty acid cis/trans isomerase n=1 Tax=Pseudomonas sp. SWRI154 TaxID=2745501 RepID=UPI00320B381F